MLGLAIFLGLVWLSWEIASHNDEQPAAPDPYRYHRWLAGEGSEHPDACG